MSLFKSLMFIEDAPLPSLDLEDDGEAFGPTFGNHLASERRFREPWEPRRHVASPVPADLEACDAGGCA